MPTCCPFILPRSWRIWTVDGQHYYVSTRTYRGQLSLLKNSRAARDVTAAASLRDAAVNWKRCSNAHVLYRVVPTSLITRVNALLSPISRILSNGRLNNTLRYRAIICIVNASLSVKDSSGSICTHSLLVGAPRILLLFASLNSFSYRVLISVGKVHEHKPAQHWRVTTAPRLPTTYLLYNAAFSPASPRAKRGACMYHRQHGGDAEPGTYLEFCVVTRTKIVNIGSSINCAGAAAWANNDVATTSPLATTATQLKPMNGREQQTVSASYASRAGATACHTSNTRAGGGHPAWRHVILSPHITTTSAA